MWWSRYWRNNMLMGEESWSIDAVVYKAHASHDEFRAFLAKDIQKEDNPRLIRWYPPKGDEVKVNVDESFLVSNGIMGQVVFAVLPQENG